MSQLIVVGSARIDAFMDLPDDKADSFCSIDTKKCVVELSYAAKIPLRRVSFLLGGNGANVAIGTKRLGIDSALVAEIGTGVMGDFAKRELEKEIDTQFVSQQEGVPAGFGAVIVYQGERTILSYYPPVTPKFPENAQGTWAYLTSTGEQFEEYFEGIYTWIQETRPRLAFNPGGRQIAKGREWIKKYLEVTDILIVNREEGEEIAGFTGSYEKEKELIGELARMGAKQIVVTDGMRGAYAFDGNKFWHSEVLPIDAIERTGAGDAFSTGILSATIQGKPMQEALLWGTVNSGSVIGYVGPQDGLLKSEDLPTWFERAESSGVGVREF